MELVERRKASVSQRQKVAVKPVEEKVVEEVVKVAKVDEEKKAIGFLSSIKEAVCQQQCPDLATWSRPYLQKIPLFDRQMTVSEIKKR
jgi:hypothetical protein